MSDTTRLAASLRERGITSPEMFALRYGRRLRDLTPAKVLEIITAPAVRRAPPVPPTSSGNATVQTEAKER